MEIIQVVATILGYFFSVWPLFLLAIIPKVRPFRKIPSALFRGWVAMALFRLIATQAHTQVTTTFIGNSVTEPTYTLIFIAVGVGLAGLAFVFRKR